uniref:Glucosyltransferase 18 n=1 Tax=Nemophila menziesii TaxID=79376 RepID=A0A387II21_NEMME|nr:glucosyltransferase 18 [Nemophila menziesii]
MQEVKGSGKKYVVLVPLALQGHITCMLQLGSILHSRGFSIIVAHPQHNSPNPQNQPEFDFVSLPDNVSSLEDTSFSNVLEILSTIFANFGSPLQDYLVQIMEKHEIVCIIYDSVMHFVDSIATHLKLPSIVMRPHTAAYNLSDLTIIRLYSENKLPMQESQLEEIVPGFHPFRFKDMSYLVTSSQMDDGGCQFWKDLNNIGSSRAIIYNTIEDLESSPLSLLQEHYKVPLFCIGPFHKFGPPIQTSLLKADNSCIAWLDLQPPNSVLYISFGSGSTMDEKQLIEAAWGLVKSEQSFIWVVRSESVNESKWLEKMPEDIQQVIRERGLIVKWAPQKEILAHSAVGGFWNHGGWNSVLESICEGIPMICTPFMADHGVITRYVTHVWRVGLEMESTSKREVIEKTIQRLMVDIEGKEMKKRALDMKQHLEVCVEKGGPSYDSIDKLTEFITSLSLNK